MTGRAREKSGTALGIGLLLLCLPFVIACAGSDGAGSELRLTLEVQDGWVREPGEECAGSRPYLYAHRSAPYRIEAAAGGDVVGSGSLPAGTAVEAHNDELGVKRVPTFCRFRLSVEIPDDGEYMLVLPEGRPLKFSVGGRNEEPILVTIP
jgi:hypothetical protein